MNITDLVERYIALRDKKAQIAQEAKARCGQIDAALEKAEGALLAFFQENGMDAASCSAGTAYSSSRTSATVADWDATLGFIKENEAWHMLERRVAKTAIEEYIKAEGDLPPGVNWREEVVINVRRS